MRFRHLVSSAKRKAGADFNWVERLLINRTNKRGLKILPCGIPDTTELA